MRVRPCYPPQNLVVCLEASARDCICLLCVQASQVDASVRWSSEREGVGGHVWAAAGEACMADGAALLARGHGLQDPHPPQMPPRGETCAQSLPTKYSAVTHMHVPESGLQPTG